MSFHCQCFLQFEGKCSTTSRIKIDIQCALKKHYTKSTLLSCHQRVVERQAVEAGSAEWNFQNVNSCCHIFFLNWQNKWKVILWFCYSWTQLLLFENQACLVFVAHVCIMVFDCSGQILCGWTHSVATWSWPPRLTTKTICPRTWAR